MSSGALDQELRARRNALGGSVWPPLAPPLALRPELPAPLIALRPLVVLIICTWSRPPALARYSAASATAISSAYSRLLPLSSAATPIDTVTFTRSPPVARSEEHT